MAAWPPKKEAIAEPKFGDESPVPVIDEADSDSEQPWQTLHYKEDTFFNMPIDFKESPAPDQIYLSEQIEQLEQEFIGIIKEDDRYCQDDVKHTQARVLEMDEVWNAKAWNVKTGNRYCQEMHKSGGMCTHAPTVFTPSEIKYAAYLVNNNRDCHNDILEVEVPRSFLTEEVFHQLEKSRDYQETAYDDGETIVTCIDRRTGGMTYLIERDTPNLTT